MKASMFDKITQFAKSPKGQRMIREATGKAQKFANDPKNRAKIDDLRRRFMGGTGGTGGTGRPH
jgi:hypothetical protein